MGLQYVVAKRIFGFDKDRVNWILISCVPK